MIEELKTFISVVECNNFTKAGEKIGLSQPSVSIHIKNLESYFNTSLIQRSVRQKKIYVTEQGRLLYDRAKRIVEIIDETANEFKGFEAGTTGTLRMGCSFTIGEYFIPKFLGEFSRAHGGITLRITIENSAHIGDKLERHELDLGLIEGTVDRGKFEHGSFYEDNMVLVASSQSPVARGSLDFLKKEFEEQTWIGREEGSGTREYFDFFLSSNKINPKNTIILGSNYAIKEAVKNNVGVAFISKLVVEEEVKKGELAVIPTDGNYTRDFSYIYPRESKLSKASELLIDMIRK